MIIPMVDLIAMLDKPADAAFAVSIASKINVDNLLKAFALDVATGNWDDYMYNKNIYFLYHSPVSGKFEFLSYDTDPLLCLQTKLNSGFLFRNYCQEFTTW
jgi:spore coat protein CotH